MLPWHSHGVFLSSQNVSQHVPKRNNKKQHKEQLGKDDLHPHAPYLSLYPTYKTTQHICLKTILMLPLEMLLHIKA
jgi:hypothetical protein